MTGSSERRSRALVLVVDDDAAVSASLERCLHHLGYEVLIAASGTEGFRQALQAEPEVILADVHMPGMDGHALLRRLTRSGLQSSVVLMSGQGELDDAIGAIRGGAVDYLKKPWNLEELKAALDRAMGLFGALRELSGSPEVARSTGPSRAGAAPTFVDAAALVEALVHDATSESLTLPIVQPALALLRGGAAATDDSVDEVMKLLDEDAMLSAAFARMASGADQPRRIPGDLRGVITGMGHAAIRDMLETLVLRNAFPIEIAALRTLNDRIWRFSVSRALAMRGIADMAEVEGTIDPHQFYLAGLLLDVGASYLLSQIAGAMKRRGSAVSDPAAMTAAVAAHHGRIGALIIERWGLSSELAALVRNHHADSSRTLAPLWCAAALGGALAVRISGFGNPAGEQDLSSESLARCAYTLGVGDTGLRRLTKSLAESANHIWAACA